LRSQGRRAFQPADCGRRRAGESSVSATGSKSGEGPERDFAQLRTELQPRFTELNDEVARLYATSFSEQELKEILAFYKTPSGKKLLTEQPKMVDDSMKFAQDWANKLSDQVVAKMRDELKKRGHAL
jgi:hypothetical protein